MLPKKIRGKASRFSCPYSPGATKAQAWYINQGRASNTPAIISTFRGTKNGEKTPTAISLAPGGMWARIGPAIRSIRPLGDGQIASKAMQTTSPIRL